MNDTKQEGLKNEHVPIHSRLFWAFFKTGIIGFGGGPSVIPLIRHEVVKSNKWMSDEQFSEIFALANVLPGPIATKMAAYTGYHLKGKTGAIVAIVAHILPSSIAMVALLSLVERFADSVIVQGMISAIVPVVAVMLAMMTYEFMSKSWRGLGAAFAIAAFAIALALIQGIHIHSAVVIIMFIVYGAMHDKVIGLFHIKKRKGEE